MSRYKIFSPRFLLGTLVLLVFFASFHHKMRAEEIGLSIKSDSRVDQLMTDRNFTEAEKLAREKNLDPRVIATIMAHAGKKDEAFAMLFEFIRTVSDDVRKKIAFQAVNLMTSVNKSLGKEFFDELIRLKVLSLNENEALCSEVAMLVRDDQIEEAERLFEQILDSTYADNELVYIAMPLIAKMNLKGDKKDKVKSFLDKLLKKFPENPDLRLQRIDSLALLNPKEALADLNSMKNSYPEFYTAMEPFIHLLRAKAFENLGERDRAKSEYSMIIDTDFGMVAKGKINEYVTKERLERELQEKIAQVNKTPQYELTPQSSRRFWVIFAINVVFILAIIYMIYRKRARS